MATEQVGKVTILGVRLSFASLFETNKQDQEDGTVRETWKSNFLIPKDGVGEVEAIYKGNRMSILKALKAAKADAMEKKWGSDPDKWPKIKADRVFLRDGDEEDWDGYAGQYYISANAALNDRPSVVTNRKSADGRWIQAEPGAQSAPYSGCYVNAVIMVWAQDNKHGKRVNAMLKSVQFVKDGEAFGAAPVNPDDEFSDDMVSSEGSIADDHTSSDEDGFDLI